MNVPADYPFDAFKDLYFEAWKAGLKGIATYRPNSVLGAVLEVGSPAVPAAGPQDFDTADPDRRIRLDRALAAAAVQPALARPPELANGNPCWTYVVRHPLGDFAVFIGHVDDGTASSVRSLDQRHRAAARPGRHRQDAVDGHAHRRSRVARHEALGAAEGRRRRRLRDGDAARRPQGTRAEPRRGIRAAHPLSLQRAGRVRRRRHRQVAGRRRADGHRRSRKPAPTAR